MRIDSLRILASLFWIGGSILTFIVALETCKQDNKGGVKHEIERIEKEFQIKLEELKNKLQMIEKIR
ncbi:hypothetical protein Curi_c11050 [Gottschalkia acidurici 9a]|uniref:Uncharacterized protein n=1 Tax=Gottschalkia acidurici (strain ATCC 7906 / DSM 604 / BCRC 14475 / CIP 104303 / KCTC 5404 / NCIMB 10678 / 9a) TaxID=1128398 RepID=K0AY23_GOTA9|nr:hypothetical protein [Gottschalkia acidurici]AFS78119.1 hypothetical protein Curi_c11050 [Gottschalkia acidurici 9a]